MLTITWEVRRRHHQRPSFEEEVLMSREVETRAWGKRISAPSRLPIARLLFLAGALSRCVYAFSVGLSRQRLLNSPEAEGAAVAFLAFALEHVAWWRTPRNADQSRTGWAKKAGCVRVALFIGVTLDNAPQGGRMLLAMWVSTPFSACCWVLL